MPSKCIGNKSPGLVMILPKYLLNLFENIYRSGCVDSEALNRLTSRAFDP